MAGEPETLIRREGQLGRITLNRPKAINALTLGMIDAISAALAAWRADDSVRAVVFDGAGERGFCAGGDIRALYDIPPPRTDFAFDYWRREYLLDHLISTYGKPVIALIHGLTMGGGAGIALNAAHRIVDSAARFAVPETGIGLAPDAGATWFLTRREVETAIYLALTGESIGAGDMLALRLADAVIDRDGWTAFLEGLTAALQDGADAASAIASLLKVHSRPSESELAPLRPKFKACFLGETVEAILAALAADGSDWAIRAVAAIRARSPTMQKVALRALREGERRASLAECLTTEFRIVCRAASEGELFEGIRAAVIDKDRQPRWRPARLEEVSDAAVDSYFAPLGQDLAIPEG